MNTLKQSYIYKMFVAISNWLTKIFSESALIGFFIKDVNHEKRDTETIFVKLINKIIEVLRKVFSKLKLDKLFDNSIFAKPMIWLSLTVFLTPFLPTMVCIAMIIFTGLSLFLKLMIIPKFKLKYFKSNLWILLFILVIAVSAFTSISVEESYQIALVMIAFAMSYFVIINTVETKKQLKFLLYLFVIAAALSAVYGIYQYIFGDVYSQAWLDSEMFEDIKMRVYSTFENPNVYGEYLILVIPIAVGLMWTEKGFWKKLFLFGIVGITTLAMVLTFSRGCWLGILFALALLAIMIDRRFILLGVVALLAMPFVLPETIINRFMSIGDMSDSSTSYRVYIWMGTLAMLKDYWFCGVGLGETSYNTIYPLYSYNNIEAPHSHNLYLQFVSQFGIIGLITFLGMVYNFYKDTTIKMLKKKDIVLAGIVAGMTGFFLEGMFDYTWYNYRVILIFWMVIAFGIVATKLEEKEEGKE
ncbi:MAG: O-antigen ligase family protein [Clostridia bacterium]|nr:O-antigen ligase family protein [Clostridia bacterium]